MNRWWPVADGLGTRLAPANVRSGVGLAMNIGPVWPTVVPDALQTVPKRVICDQALGAGAC